MVLIENYISLFKRILLIFVFYSISRVIFQAYNFNQFHGIECKELSAIYLFGLRFDTFSILVSNSLFILLSILPFQYFHSFKFQQRLKYWYVFSNALFLAFNFIDIAYFRFIGRRSTSDLFYQLSGQTNVLKQLPFYVRDFWHIILLFIISIISLYKLYPEEKGEAKTSQPKPLLISLYSLINLALIGVCVLGIRGGFQRVPISIVNAGSYTKPQYSSLVLNSSFTIIKSFGSNEINELNFYPDSEVRKIINPIKYFRTKEFTKQNIVVLILESFSKEYTGIGGRKSITPFLDSLSKESLVFTSAWANGTKSIEGIPAILASLPSLDYDPFINSKYATNNINSFASLLKTKNYQTAFFHGGINGTMNFDSFAKQAGFDDYYGKNEYNNEDDFDGNWGIWDDKYLRYCAKQLNDFKEPFMASIFTLSSHHPYNIPKQFKGRFPRTNLENSESIGYADYSLKQFFEVASKSKWYKNTIFVLVADHASISEDPFYANLLGQHAIPLLIFNPDGSLKGECHEVTQQIDILPTILSHIGFDTPFFAMGNDVLKNHDNYAVFQDSGNLFLLNDSMLFTFSNYNVIQCTNFKSDSLLEFNQKKYSSQGAVKYLKSFMQVINESMIKNKMTIVPNN